MARTTKDRATLWGAVKAHMTPEDWEERTELPAIARHIVDEPQEDRLARSNQPAGSIQLGHRYVMNFDEFLEQSQIRERASR